MKGSVFKKSICLIIVLSMVLSFAPFTNVFAASPSSSYTYQIKVKNGDVTYAGTDGDVYCVVKTYSRGTLTTKIDSKANDFERNDCRTYDVSLEVQPWDIKEVGLKNTGKDGMHVAWFEFKLPNGTWIRKDVNAWFEHQGNKVYERTYSVMSQVDRQISARGNFDSQFQGTAYFETDDTSENDKVMEWNGLVTDQYFSNYNFFGYYGAVGVSFNPSGTSYGYSDISSINQMTSNNLATVGEKDGYQNKLTLKMSNLLRFMKNNKVYQLDIKSTIDYLYESDEYPSFSKTYSIIRKGFELEKATAITPAYTPSQDNHFYNKEHNTFEIQIPVKKMNHYNATTIASSLAANIKSGASTATVSCGASGSAKITNVYSSGANIYLQCTAPENYANNAGTGLTVEINNAKATYNGQTYKLDRDNAYYTHYISTHKVDTKGLTHTVKDASGNTVDPKTGFDTYEKEHTFQLQVDAGENVYIYANEDSYLAKGEGERTVGFFSYRLYDGNTEIALAKHNGSKTSLVQHAGNTVYHITPTQKIEGSYQLKIASRDFANNLETTVLPVKLDNKAPRATFTVKEVSDIAGGKRNEYSFKIDDVSGTGKLYYAFVRKGQNIPSTTEMKPAGSGAVDTVYEKWGFIDQKNSQAQTIVLALPEGERFEGTLFWYTVDSAGNVSTTEKNTGTDKNGYYYTNVLLDNTTTECELILDDATPGKTSYNISFKTAAANKVKYKWTGTGFTTALMDYTSKTNPGTAAQKSSDGRNVTLSGTYTLHYVVTTPGGNSETYTREFVFDNTKPEITFGETTGETSPTKRMTINVRDVMAIQSLQYQLYTAGGEAVGEAVVLDAGSPVVSNEITLSPEKTGAYKVTVTATDVNGQTSERTSNVFSVRTAAPTVTTSVNIDKEFEGTPVTNSQNYQITLQAEEEVADIDAFAANQVMRYRTSADGINYGDWVTVSNVTKSAGKLAATAYVFAPIALNSGENRIYIQVAFTGKDADTAKIRNELITTNDGVQILYDTQPPQYKFNIGDSDYTNQSVFATLTYTDNYTSADSITLYNSNWGINLTENSVSSELAVYDVEISENVYDNKISLTDMAGNLTAIPITVTCIDKTAPDYQENDTYSIEAGERGDYFLSFYVDQAMEDQTEFALIEVPVQFGPSSTDPSDTSAPQRPIPSWVDPSTVEEDLFGPMPDSVDVINIETEYDYENGEKQTLYEVIIRGGEDEEAPPTPEIEDYPDVDAYTEAYNEWVANGSPEGEEPVQSDYIDYDAYDLAWTAWSHHNTKGYELVVKATDALGNTGKDGSTVLVTNATARLSEVLCSPQKASTKTALVMEASVPIYVMPPDQVPQEITALDLPDGRLDTSENNTVVQFAEKIVNAATYYTETPSIVIDSTGEKAVYFTDECGRVYKQTVTVKDLSEEENGEYDPLTCYVEFGNEPPVTVTLYREDEDGNRETLDAEETKALDFISGYRYYVELAADPGENQEVLLYDDFTGDDFTLNHDLSEGTYYYEYTKAVFEIEDTTNLNKVLSYVAYVETDGIEEEVGSVFELNLKDATAPETDVVYSTKGYTNKDVIATVSAFDPELMTSPDANDTNAPGEDSTAGDEVQSKEELTAAEAAEQAGIRSMAVSAVMDDLVDDPTTLSYTDLGQVSKANITFEKNGYAVVKVTNTLGLVSYQLIEVHNINKAAIIEGTHYNVKYYTNDGETEVDPEGYYKEVIAKIEITTEGEEERGLYVSNNMRETAKTLDSFDNQFTFDLKDQYGNVADVHVRFDRFDLDGPVISYELADKGKTNQPVDVYLRVSDLLSSVGELPTLTAPDGTELEVTDETPESDNPKTFKATVPESGIYKVTATDSLGNESYLNFIVNNIDKTAPEVIEQVATSVAPTTQTVGVKLYYSKPGVVITKAEAVDQGSTTISTKDYAVDYNNSSLRFYENGSVAVVFVDEYGNEGTEIVTVSNINRTPPALRANPVVAEDMLSVQITFEQKLDGDGSPVDPTRELSDLTVLYHGMAALDEEGNVATADKASYTLIENGTYTFHVIDSIGNTQVLDVEIDGIDKAAPVITQVSWSYVYYDENGEAKPAEHSLTPGTEAGYNIVEDETYLPTNQDITATVTTDKGTKFVGASTNEYETEHSVIYDADGWFNFNLARPNNLMTSYGLGLYLIDKEPPVIEGVEDLMFFENPKAGAQYDKALLTYSAYDERYGVKTDLTDKVTIDWGDFNPDDITKNTFDKNKPYTITYTVKDHVGNETQVRRTITLVGLFDAMARVNGIYPDSSGRIEVVGDSVEIGIDNFSGTAYARYEKGIYTMGEMKHIGTVIPQSGDKFKLEKLSRGWYTFYIQTDLRDYFCINVYITGNEEEEQ